MLRRRHGALRGGNYRPVGGGGDLLLYMRADETEAMLIAINMGRETSSVRFVGGVLRREVLVSTFRERAGERVDGSIDLHSDEGILVRLSADAILPV